MNLDEASYSALKKVAAYYMANERADHTLCPTALVNEAYLKFQNQSLSGHNKASFMLVAARNMRQILVNHALARNAQKRGDGERTCILVDDLMAKPAVEMDILHLDDALKRLETLDPIKVRIIELRFFSGMTYQEVAAELALSISTVKRKWTVARAWLYRDLN